MKRKTLAATLAGLALGAFLAWTFRTDLLLALIEFRAAREAVGPPQAVNWQGGTAQARDGRPNIVFILLDDLGINLKPAKAMGMQTIKVVDPDIALEELEAIIEIPLR